MENLWFNVNAEFTKWVTTRGLLKKPFTVVDVGVQGDASPRWNLLGDYLIFHGFDPIREVIDELKLRNASRPNRHFHNMAIGNVDEERPFYLNAANPTASSMYEQGVHRFDMKTSEQAYTVNLRRLDTLLATGLIPKADFLKVDVEGFEREVFLGARDLIRAGVLGVETESNFNASPTYPKSHFVAISELLIKHHLLVFDFGFNRVSRAGFQRALQRYDRAPCRSDVGKPATLNVLFCRDLIDEADHQENYRTVCRPVSVDQMIKTMIVYELYGLNDIALDIAERFADQLGTRLDVEQAIYTLADPNCGPEAPCFADQLGTRLDVEQAIYTLADPNCGPEAPFINQRRIEQSNSWRVTVSFLARAFAAAKRWAIRQIAMTRASFVPAKRWVIRQIATTKVFHYQQEYQAYAQTDSVIESYNGTAVDVEGVSIMGYDWQPKSAGDLVRVKVVVPARTEYRSNSIVAALFVHPVAVSKVGAHELSPGHVAAATVEFEMRAPSTQPINVGVRVGPARPGRIYLNGGEKGPLPNMPKPTLTIDEYRLRWFFRTIYLRLLPFSYLWR